MKLPIIQSLREQSKFDALKKNKVPLTPEEKQECLDKKAVWHFSHNKQPTAAVWKSENNNKKTTYITSSHRAYNTAKTLKGAIGRFHDFIKGTS
jgi:hypothetical protein